MKRIDSKIIKYKESLEIIAMSENEKLRAQIRQNAEAENVRLRVVMNKT